MLTSLKRSESHRGGREAAGATLVAGKFRGPRIFRRVPPHHRAGAGQAAADTALTSEQASQSGSLAGNPQGREPSVSESCSSRTAVLAGNTTPVIMDAGCLCFTE